MDFIYTENIRKSQRLQVVIIPAAVPDNNIVQ